MSSDGGGIPGGRGYHYQNLYTALQLARLLTEPGRPEHLVRVYWEKKQIDFGVDLGLQTIHVEDVVLVHASRAVTFIDVKSSAAHGRRWTLSDLTATRGPLRRLWRQWQAFHGLGRTVCLALVTGAAADELVSLAQAAHGADTPKELAGHRDPNVSAGVKLVATRLDARIEQLYPFLEALEVEDTWTQERLKRAIDQTLPGESADLGQLLVDVVARSRNLGRDDRLSHTRDSLVVALSRGRAMPRALVRPGGLVEEWADLEGLHVWTGRLAADPALVDLGHRFDYLGKRFEEWLEIDSFNRAGGLPVAWIQDDEREYRAKGLRACLAQAFGSDHLVANAHSDLGLAVTALDVALKGPPPPRPPLIAIDLRTDQSEEPWIDVLHVLDRARDAGVPAQGAHPRLVIAANRGQMDQAIQVLENKLELVTLRCRRPMPKLRKPRVRRAVRTRSFDRMSERSAHMYNRGLSIKERPLHGRGRELGQLRRAWASGTTRVYSLVAMGGMGKSALVTKWLVEMATHDFEDADRVLAWSFYSQGTRENLVSADLFINEALNWLGDDSPVTLSAARKGRRLAELIRAQKSLVVLDGLEPLQAPPRPRGRGGGALRDLGIKTLLEELAKPGWDGLCVVTTRVAVDDLRPFEKGGGGRVASAVCRDLGPLPTEGAVRLLRSRLGPRAPAPDGQLERTVAELKRHPLAIILMGTYLRRRYGGDVTRRRDVAKDTFDPKLKIVRHAEHMMTAYTRSFERDGQAAAVALLRLLGLFERPAEPQAMAALLANHELKLLTADLGMVGSEVWDECVRTLSAAGLIVTDAGPPGTIDAHPLVREHFRHELRGLPTLWAAGNRTLMHHYVGKAPVQPSSAGGMQDLYAAVTHGCAAGLHREVFYDVLLKRVWRDRRTNYSTRLLGLTGADLAALSNYFEGPGWTRLSPGSDLPSSARVLLMTNAGVRLRQLGNLAQARGSFGTVISEIEAGDPRDADPAAASYALAQNCELLIIAGRLHGRGKQASALSAGRRAVEYADRGTDPYFKMHARSSLAEVHLMLGDTERAADCFVDAMRIERDEGPRPPFLYSQGLYRYGYFLIDERREAEIVEGSRDPTWGTNARDSSLLSRAIRPLIVGAAHRSLMEREAALADPDAAFACLEESSAAFREAGYPDYVVKGLVERVHFLRVRRREQDYQRAFADLEEAELVVRKPEMALLRTDVNLQRVGAYLAFWPELTRSDRRRARGAVPELLTSAAADVMRFRYRRRAEMLGDLKRQAKGRFG